MTTSSDAKYFSLGLEIACLAQGIEQATAYLEYYLKTLARLAVLPMPTVAAINGHCTAGGGFFALVHDFTIVTEGKALFFMNEIDLGLGFSEGMAKILKCVLPVFVSSFWRYHNLHPSLKASQVYLFF